MDVYIYMLFSLTFFQVNFLTRQLYICCKHRVAKTHRIPYLHRLFSAKVTYI